MESPERDADVDELDAQPFHLNDAQLDRGVVTMSYDMPVRELLAEIASNALVVHPKFQRESVWGRDRQSKLLESLLVKIPIPTLYFAEDDDGTKVVVDGQQRLRAIQEFHAGRYLLKRLEVLPKMNGKRWADLTPGQSETVLDSMFRCVVIPAGSPATLRFEMFERLSTGGLPLNDQELRNSVFRGSFNDLLHDLVRTTPWLAAVEKPTPDMRMKHEELALRFFAFRAVTANYRPPLKPILNEFMQANRYPNGAKIAEMAALFERTLTNCVSVFGSRSFRRVVQAQGRPERWETNLNRAVFDVQMLGLADLPTQLVRDRAVRIREAFSRLSLSNDEFRDSVNLAPAERGAFYTRLRLWLTALRDEGIESPLLAKLPAR